jgi:N-acetylneuraminic acid mutarotase
VSNTLITFGGYDGKGGIGSIEAYEPTSNVWREVAATITPRFSHGGAVISETAYAIGGFSNTEGHLSDVQEIRNSYSVVGSGASLSRRRESLAVASLGDIIYAFGGSNITNPPYNLGDGEQYVAARGRWFPTAALRQARSGATATAIGGKIFVVGGQKNAVSVGACVTDCATAALASMELFTP